MDVTYTFNQVAFGKRIENTRKSRRFTRSDIAKELDITQQAVEYWEIGRNSPEIGCLIQLSGLLGVSLDYLLTGVGPGDGSSLKA